MKSSIQKYAQKIKVNNIHYDFFDFSNILFDLKYAFCTGDYFVERSYSTGITPFEKEFGYKLPKEIVDYINSYWHPGIFGFYKVTECINLFPVVKYGTEIENDILFQKNGIINRAKRWNRIFGGNINKYLPIGWLTYSEMNVLYNVKSGKVYLEDINNEGNPEINPIAESLKDLILNLQPSKNNLSS